MRCCAGALERVFLPSIHKSQDKSRSSKDEEDPGAPSVGKGRKKIYPFDKAEMTFMLRAAFQDELLKIREHGLTPGTCPGKGPAVLDPSSCGSKTATKLRPENALSDTQSDRCSFCVSCLMYLLLAFRRHLQVQVEVKVAFV